MTYQEYTDIRKRAAYYKPKKTQPDGELFRQDVLKLMHWLDDIEQKVNAVHMEMKL